MKSFIGSMVVLVLVVTGVVVVLYQLLRHEPAEYAQAAIPPGERRQTESREFEKQAIDLINEIRNEHQWQAEFTEEQVNSWLAEDFIRSNLAKQLPPGISEPRVVFQPGKLFLAFRYGEDGWNSVISVEAKVWVVKREPNVIAVQIDKVRAGALPLAPKVLQDQLTEGARRQDISVRWYRHEGQPVAILRFQYERRQPTVQLQELELREGSIFLKGRSLEPGFEFSGEGELTLETPQ